MKYTINYKDIGYNTSSAEVEALRRAVEIRSLNNEMKGKSWKIDGVETYVWETALCHGSFEVEIVTVCESSGVVTYSRTETAIAS